MRVRRVLWVVVVLLLFLMPVLALAQSEGVLFMINGVPDAVSSPPQVRTYVSVIDKQNANVVTGLGPSNFILEEAGARVDNVNVSTEDVGLAAVIVIDRGGISRSGDQRIKQATDLSREFMNRMTVTGQRNDDMVAIVGVHEEGELAPKENFSYDPVDTNLVMNALVIMETEIVPGVTPLYEGLDGALELLTHNGDTTIRNVLNNRRKIILVFSDGIDTNYSDEAREQDIIRKAKEADISLYTVGMASGKGQLGSASEMNLKRLASQTYGEYQLHNTDTHDAVLDLFARVVTQRQQYVLNYETEQPKGDYTLKVTVETDVGSAESSRGFSSILTTPELYLSVSPSDVEFSIPYTRTEEGVPALSLRLSVIVNTPDGAIRNPSLVRYYVNGDKVGESTTGPDFVFDWPVSQRHEHDYDPIVEEFTLIAEAVDPYLGRSYTTKDPVKITVIWEKLPLPAAGTKGFMENWGLILVLVGLLVGLIVLLLLLMRTRSEFANRVVKGATGVLKGMTRRLTPGDMQQAPGKLVVQQGANMGKEFRLSVQVTKVGRDPQFSDFALFDEFASNPHFSIHLEGSQFYITDEGSTNGTKLNGSPLQAHQRVPLQSDAMIEVGTTRLQFKQLGRTTRPVDSGASGSASPFATRPMGGGGQPISGAPQPGAPQPGAPQPMGGQPGQASPYATRPVGQPQPRGGQPNPYATRPVQGQPQPGGQQPNPYTTRPVQGQPQPGDQQFGQQPGGGQPPNPYATRPVQGQPQQPGSQQNPYATRPVQGQQPGTGTGRGGQGQNPYTTRPVDKK
ncbi:MAG: FHA domain-containing protein [Anaerolineae bacterium]|nr:FHA domain-containing protein [Anaerolineae bacterium]